MSGPRVELVTWSGCSSSAAARDLLERLLAELGHAGHPVATTWVESDADAERFRFVGSPTVLLDGAEAVPPGSDGPYGLACRLYRTRGGRFSPLPDPDDLREALAGAFR
jgi:hypothetical protein